MITNGNADVRRLGLADYFTFALCAEDIGIAKPDARLFQEALQRGGATADTAVHIGDHPGDDIAGAQQAGLRAIWFNLRQGLGGRTRTRCADPQPDRASSLARALEVPVTLASRPIRSCLPRHENPQRRRVFSASK